MGLGTSNAVAIDRIPSHSNRSPKIRRSSIAFSPFWRARVLLRPSPEWKATTPAAGSGYRRESYSSIKPTLAYANTTIHTTTLTDTTTSTYITKPQSLRSSSETAKLVRSWSLFFEIIFKLFPLYFFYSVVRRIYHRFYFSGHYMLR